MKANRSAGVLSAAAILLMTAGCAATPNPYAAQGGYPTIGELILWDTPWWLVTGIVGALAVLLVWRSAQRRKRKPATSSAAQPSSLLSAEDKSVAIGGSVSSEDALTVAKRRLAAGEISKEEFDEIVSRLQ